MPLAFGILSLVLMATLAGRMLRPPFALICLSLMALSPCAIGFSKELKQYSADMAASSLLLLALWEYLRRNDSKRYFWLLSSLNYFLFIRPNTSPQLHDFWNGGYPPLSGTLAKLDFFARYFLGDGCPFLLSSSTWGQRCIANDGPVTA